MHLYKALDSFLHNCNHFLVYFLLLLNYQIIQNLKKINLYTQNLESSNLKYPCLPRQHLNDSLEQQASDHRQQFSAWRTTRPQLCCCSASGGLISIRRSLFMILERSSNFTDFLLFISGSR